MNGRTNDEYLTQGADFEDDNKLGALPNFAPPRPQAVATPETPEAAKPETGTDDAPVAVPETATDSNAPLADAISAAKEAAALADAVTATGEPQSAIPSTNADKAATPTSGAAVPDEGAQAVSAEKADAPSIPVNNPALMDALRSVVTEVLDARGENAQGVRLTDDELARVAERLNIHGGLSPQGTGVGLAAAGTSPATQGQRAQVQGVNALVEGTSSLLGGTMALAGAAGRGIGRMAEGLASLVGDKKTDAQPVVSEGVSEGRLPAVLPRLSEYRVAQLEKAANHFAREQETFWNSSTKLTALRSEMDRIARERGLPIQDVINEMKPGGELAPLREQFNAAVAENPDSGARRKAMDKAMDSYIRQFGRAQEEFLNPEQDSNPHYDALKNRVHKAQEDMEAKAAGLPAFANDKGGLDPSHFEKLREAVAKIMEKIKEVAQEFMAMLSGKHGNDNGPSI